MKKAIIINSILLIIILIISMMVGLLFIVNTTSAEEELDIIPPKISNIKVQDITSTSSVISWITDEDADSLVNYGFTKSYGIARSPGSNKTEHSILLDDLLPNMTYYFRVTSADKSGNQGISSNFVFETPKETKSEAEGKKNSGEEENAETSAEEEKFNKKADEENEYDTKFDEHGEYDAMYDKKGKQTEEYDKTGGASETDLKNRGSKEFFSAEKEAGSLGEVIKALKGVNTEKNLEIIQEELNKIAEAVSDPLVILLDKANLEVGVDYVIIKWKTNKLSNSVVSMVLDSEYNENAENPYAWQEGKLDELVEDHILEVNGLSPATTYHFQVSAKTLLGVETKSDDMEFTTDSILPQIFNIKVLKVEEDSATIEWGTNVPCSSILEYTNLMTGETKLAGSSNYITSHSIQIKDLDLDTYYSAMIKVENEQGKRAESTPFTFLTVKDEEPPIISKIKTESTIYPGLENKIQTVITWSTDEFSQCQFFYQQGISNNDKVKELAKEDNFSQEHVQVTTDLLHSTVYKFWVECSDEAGNLAKSENFTILTPTKEKNIIDIILGNFENAFGWTKNMGM